MNYKYTFLRNDSGQWACWSRGFMDGTQFQLVSPENQKILEKVHQEELNAPHPRHPYVGDAPIPQ